MSDPAVETVLDILSNRKSYLRPLLDGPLRKGELHEHVKDSRPTVDRAVRELESVNLITRTTDGYQATLCGVLAANDYTAYVNSIEQLCAAEPLLASLPPTTPITTEVVADGIVHTGDRHAPEKPVHKALAPVHDAEQTHLLSPTILPSYVEVFHDRVVDDAMDAELLFTSPVIQRLTSRYTERVSDILETGRAAIYETSNSLPFGVFLPGTVAQKSIVLTVSTPTGVHGAIVNDTPEAVAWGEDIYDKYKQEANRLSTPAAD